MKFPSYINRPHPEYLREGNKAGPADHEHLPVLYRPAADRAEPEVPGIMD